MFNHTDYQGGTPDVFNEINGCNIRLDNQNMVAKAIVITSSINFQILESRAPMTNADNTNVASAIEWLKSQ